MSTNPTNRVATRWLEASDTLDKVRDSVARAHVAAWGEAIRPATLRDAVADPTAVARRNDPGVEGSLAVIWTEYAGLSQYDNDVFWRALATHLKRHGLHYEWVDGGTASIWPLAAAARVKLPTRVGGLEGEVSHVLSDILSTPQHRAEVESPAGMRLPPAHRGGEFNTTVRGVIELVHHKGTTRIGPFQIMDERDGGLRITTWR